MSAIMSIGQYAKNPYKINSLEMNVYCLEELSFLLKENAYLLDKSIMKDELAEFLANECDLESLGLELSRMIHKKGSLSLFVSTILDYSGLFSDEEVIAVASVLRQGGKMTDLEKQKIRVDRLVEMNKLEIALEEYDVLISQVEENLEVEDWSMRGMLGKLWYNKGVAFTKMMRYKRAAECFLEAAKQDPRGEYQREYLAAMRLGLMDRDYISFIAEHPEYYEYSIALEKETAESLNKYAASKECKEFEQIKKLEDDGKKMQYYDEMNHLVNQLAEDYRGGKL